MEPKTADLYDQLGSELQVVQPMLRDYGGRRAFSGQLSTVLVHEDNVLVREALASPGAGRVLVVDGGGSLRCALLGDRLAELGIENGWAGAVVYGCVRDSEALAQLPFGVKALATNPRPSARHGHGQRDVLVRFGDAQFSPGAWLYADGDGVVVAARSGRPDIATE